jgi:apolipoprotein N-acyltransferase
MCRIRGMVGFAARRGHLTRPGLAGTADDARTRAVVALGALGGLLAALAVPPSPSPIFALVGMAPLFAAAALARSIRSAALAGLVTGILATGAGFRFLVSPMLHVGGLSPLAASLVYALLTAWHAAPFALAAALGAASARRGGSAPLVAAVALATLERVWPVPIPWCFGAGLQGVPHATMTAALAGPLGPTLLAFLASAALGERLARALGGSGRAPERRAQLVAAVALPVALGSGFLLARAAADDAARAPKLTIGLVQPGVGARVADLVGATDDLAARGAALVVWSEGALPGVVDEADAAGLVDATLRGHGGDASVLVGAVTRDRAGSLHNAAILTGRGGDGPATYQKRSLLPFAERLPLERELPWLRALSPRSGRFVAGARTEPVTVRGAPVALAICYEDLLAEPLRDEANASRARLLVNLTNDAWFAGSSARETHAEMARLRAIELGRALVRATADGATIAFGPDGSELARASSEGAATLLVDVPLSSRATFYASHGAWPAWALTIALALFGARRRSSATSSAPS